MKKKLVEIHWIDAEADSGWTSDDPRTDSPKILKTYGLLVRKTDQWVIHADTFDSQNNHWAGKGKIPRGMVKKIRVIETVDV